jgi:hypothetical protein
VVDTEMGLEGRLLIRLDDDIYEDSFEIMLQSTRQRPKLPYSIFNPRRSFQASSLAVGLRFLVYSCIGL